jgi:hypothetical protein
VAADGDRVFVATGTSRLLSIDALNPAAPVALDTLAFAGETVALSLRDSVLYVAGGAAGLWTVSAARPDSLHELAHLVLPGYAQSVDYGQDHVYVACGSSGVRVVDARDPAAPYQAGWFETAYASGLAAGARDLLLADGYDGVRLLRDLMVVPTVVRAFGAVREARGVRLVWSLAGADGLRVGVERLLADGTTRTIGAARGGAGPQTLFDTEVSDGRVEYLLVLVADDGASSVLARAVVGPRPAAGGLSAAPNPFNPRTTLRYELPVPGRTELAVHDLRGRRVARLLDAPQAAGPHALAWDGRDAAGRALPSGTYLVHLRQAGMQRTLRVQLVR